MGYTTYSISEFINCRTDLQSKIQAIDILIDKMFIACTESIDGAGVGIGQYSLDDGQVKINTTYRSVEQVKAGIDSLEQLKQMYVNRLRGRVGVLRNENTFRR